MKRKILLLSACFFFSLGAVYAQGEMDAFKLSQEDLTGSARSVSMGGAFGALGGDIGGVAINPAGIGVYRSSEIVTTLNFQNTKAEASSNVGKIGKDKFKFNFDNLAFVTAIPLNSDVAPLLNFGFSYNRLKNFDRQYRTEGKDLNLSMAHYMAHRANTSTSIKNPNDLDLENGDDPLYDHDWMAVFGYNSGLIGVNDEGGYGVIKGMPQGAIYNSLYSREKGSVSSYDFNMGTTFSDLLSIGLTLSVTDIKYHLFSDYNEDYAGYNNTGFTLSNELKSEGAGFQVTAGVILKPINEFRIGVAYHSPTWYNMTDYYYAIYDYNITSLATGREGRITTPAMRYDYRMRTPDKWTVSMAGVLGQVAIISADYEYTNYSNNMRLFEDNGKDIALANESIKNHYKGASTLRVGAEVRFTPQFSGRVGYAWMQSPLKKEFRDGKHEAMTVGSINQYTLDGDRNYFTYGLGYRFSRHFYTDIAFVMGSQKSDLLPFDIENKGQASALKVNTFQGLLTLGYKF